MSLLPMAARTVSTTTFPDLNNPQLAPQPSPRLPHPRSLASPHLPSLTLPWAMRQQRTLLVLLAYVAATAAQSTPECKDGLDKLNNKSGMSPCTVGKQLRQACNDDSSSSHQCSCSNVAFNIGAACAACSGDGPPSWAQWADDHSCDSNPQQFPSDVNLDQVILPAWANLSLTEENEFNMSAAILTANATGNTPINSGRSNTAAQVVVPIVAGIGVALIATLTFWACWRRKHRDPRMKALPLTPGSRRPTWRPWRYMQIAWPSTRSRGLRPSKKDSGWAIEDDDADVEWVGHTRPHTAVSYVDPYNPQERLTDEPLALEELDVPHTSAHLQETSSSSLLPHIEFPNVRVPTVFERFISSKDGVRKSPAYKSKYVRPTSPDPQFRIDEPTPVKDEFEVDESRLSASGRRSGLRAGARESRGASSSRTQPGLGARSEHDSQSEGVGSGVLLISRTGQDFTLDDSPTIAPASSHASSPNPNTPHPSTQHSPISPVQGSAYTGYSGSRTGTTGTGTWLPSPNRANTSSTISGAYPFELRQDPDLTSSRSWASRFPVPPQAFAQAPGAFRSFSDQIGNLSAHNLATHTAARSS